MRLTRLGLVAVLLVPSGVARASACTVVGPSLEVDVRAACGAVLAAVPGWNGFAAIRFGDGDASVAAETVSSTITVHPEAWRRLTPAGRQEVLTHELVHVATDAITTTRTPQWLVEGLAESVAMRASAIPDRVAGQELAAARLPTHLPTGADFAATPALAYEESWLAVDVLVREHGMPWVLAAYHTGRVEEPWLLDELRAEILRRLS